MTSPDNIVNVTVQISIQMNYLKCIIKVVLLLRFKQKVPPQLHHNVVETTVGKIRPKNFQNISLS